MIKGRYVKKGEITEVEIGNGIVELVPECRELKVFTFESRKRGTFKRYEGISMANAVTLGIAAGLTCGSLVASFITFADWPFRLLLLGTLILDTFIVFENLTKEVTR